MNPSDAELSKSFPMGENTNDKIGGVEDWQDVPDPKVTDFPPLGPVARILSKESFEVERGNGPGITLPPINAKSTGGKVDKPVYATSGAGSYSKNVSLKYDGGINASASGENLSAKFKNPNKKQDIDPVQKQYMD